MRRSIRVLVCALGFGVGFCICAPVSRGVALPVAHAANAEPNANDCMSFQNDVQEKSIVVHASNVCERKLSCSLSYVVRCEDNEGKQTSSSSGSAHFALGAHGEAKVPMSAEQCKQGWRIDNVAWVCH